MISGRLLAILTLVGALAAGLVVDRTESVEAAIPSDGLASTPPMGIDNWTATFCTDGFDEAMVKGIADTMVSMGYRNAGYEYVNIDDCWALPERGPGGELVPDPKRFPNGIKAVADYVHDKGLKFGIYSSAGTKTCDPNGFPGALGHEAQDAMQFAEWGVDYLKYDNCNNEGIDAEQRYRTMREALRAAGRPIVLAICEWGQNKPWTWPAGSGHLWRTGGDIVDSWDSVTENVDETLPLAEYAGPGHWNDPDLLQAGNGAMTDAQYRSQFSLWSIMAAPLMIGSDLRNASPETRAILTNADVIAIDQDVLGAGGREITSTDGVRVIAKQLAGGDVAVALSNANATAATVNANLADAGFDSGRYLLRDLWSKETRLGTGDVLTATVPGFTTTLYRLSSVDPRPAGTWPLTHLIPSNSSNGWGPFETDRSNGEELAGDGGPLTIRGAAFRHGIGVHAPSDIDFYLGGTCSTLTTSVGIDDEVHGEGSVVFQVFADDTLVADSGTMSTSSPAKSLTADVQGANHIRLVVTDAGDGIEYDHADWADPIVECG